MRWGPSSPGSTMLHWKAPSNQRSMSLHRTLRRSPLRRGGGGTLSLGSTAAEARPRLLGVALSSDCKRESPQSGKALLASADRNCLLLAWLEKCIAMGPKLSFEFIRQATGLDLLIDIVNPVLSTISDMKFKFGCNGDSTELIKKK